MPQTVVLPTSQAKNFDALPAFLDANLRGKPRQYPHGEYLSRPLTKANFQTNLVEGEGVSRHQKELYEAGPDEAIDKATLWWRVARCCKRRWEVCFEVIFGKTEAS